MGSREPPEGRDEGSFVDIVHVGRCSSEYGTANLEFCGWLVTAGFVPKTTFGSLMSFLIFSRLLLCKDRLQNDFRVVVLLSSVTVDELALRDAGGLLILVVLVLALLIEPSRSFALRAFRSPNFSSFWSVQDRSAANMMATGDAHTISQGQRESILSRIEVQIFSMQRPAMVKHARVRQHSAVNLGPNRVRSSQ
jgi:hypothetical protein